MVGIIEKRKIEVFVMLYYRKIVKIIWVEKICNKEVIQRVGEKWKLRFIY